MTKPLTWHEFITAEKEQTYLQNTIEFIEHERAAGKTIFPPEKDVFNVFKVTDFDAIKVVILGQDPYHGPNQAHGLCFSVLPDIKIPPSLRNIYKELSNDIKGFKIPEHGFLQPWAEQGVLLLNTVLTVEQGKAHSHAKLGWETFTDRVIETINQHQNDIVFLLWGAHAHKKGAKIDRSKHRVLTAPHPSPLSAHKGFFGCRHFSLTNQYLSELGLDPIDWQV